MIESSPSSPQGRPLPDAPTGNRDSHVKKGVWLFGIFAISFLVTLVVGVLVLAMGMELPGLVVGAVAFLILPLFAAISASWAGTLLVAPDLTRTRLIPVLGITLATSAVIGMIVVAGGALVSQEILRTPVIEAIIMTLDVLVLLVPLLALVLSASLATWRFRTARGRMGRGAKLTLGLAVAVFLVGYLPPLYVAGVLVEDWLNIASVALGLVLATWIFGRRRDLLGMDAAETLCLVGLVGLIFRVVGLLYTQGYFQGLY